MTMLERAELNALRKERDEWRRRYVRIRAVFLHTSECAICRIAWCTKREQLMLDALGRQRQTLRVRS